MRLSRDPDFPVRHARESIWHVAHLWTGVIVVVSLLNGRAVMRTVMAAEVDSSEISALRVTEPKTEHLTKPLGIETAHPRFRWLLESERRGELQTAYQVVVATSPEKLQAEVGDKWDSGKVASDNSVEVVYGGTGLASGERAYWKVRVWDRDGRPGPYSTPSFFEMGLRSAGDWRGTWIAAKKGISAPLLRRDFLIDGTVRRARLYISGLGYYELSINGKRIGDRVLEPASTYYNNDLPFKLRSRVLYSTYDVTDALQTGANAIGVMLGNGWYSAEADREAAIPYGDRPRLIVQLNVELSDGRTMSLESDSSWKFSAGPVTYNDLVNGETYDARLEQAGWDRPGFNDSSWRPVELAERPSGTLVAQLTPPTQVMQTLPVTERLVPRVADAFSRTYIYDFGQNFSGWARLAVFGPRGAKLVLRYGTRIFPEDDTLDTRSSMLPDESARQEDTYILKGEGTEVWEPRFTLHGFRYVSVEGFKDTPSVESIQGRVVHSALEPAGDFSGSNELLNRIHRNIRWTFRSSLQGFPQDAADRNERIGWLGDPAFVAEDYIDNFDMLGFWEKWLEDIQDTQKDNGDIAGIAPLHVRQGMYLMWPAWKSTYPLLLWLMYEHYGDRRVLEQHYPSLQKLIGFLQRNARDYILAQGLGDHMEPEERGYSSMFAGHTPPALTSTAYYYYDVALVAQMAEILGRSGEAKAYYRLAQNIRDAFNRRFFNPVTSQYATGSQTSNALPLALGIVPPQEIDAVMKNLTEDITIRHGYHVSTGIIGSNALVQVLPSHGATSLMYRLATQTSYPSLGYQLSTGATTICETYECGRWLSQNMKMFGSLDKFFYHELAGIQIAGPAYRQVRIRPQPIGDLLTVEASQKTVRGTIAVEWVRGSTYDDMDLDTGPMSFELTVSIPVGVEADIFVPNMGLSRVRVSESSRPVWESNAYISGTAGVTGAKADSDAIVFHAGSGTYHFILKGDTY